MKKLSFRAKESPVTTPTNPVNSMKQPAYHNGSSNKVAPAHDFMQMEVGKDVERSTTITTTTLTDSSSDTNVEREHGTSWAATLVNFFKGMIGPGCLSLPLAFKQAGLWTAFSLVLIFGFLNAHCMLQMVHCSQYLSKKKEREHLDYGKVAYEACANSFNSLRKYRNLAKLAVNTAILGLQIGICSVFYVFMAVHMKEVFDEQTSFHGSETAWMMIIFLPVVLLNFIRTLKAIAVISMIGNVLMIGAFVFILQHLLRADHVTSQLPWFTNFNGVMTACGSIMYAFEGQAMVLPLENKLKRPGDMIGPFGVLSVGVSLVSAVYAGSGLFGYITYGSDVKGSITLNLPQKLTFTIVKLMLTLVVYFGFVIQQYVIVEMLWPNVRTKIGEVKLLSKQGWDLPLELVFRAGLVTIAMLIALAVPNLEQIIPLVGITAGMLLAFIFPPLMDTMTFLPVLLEKSKQTSRWSIFARIFKNSLLVMIGVFGLVAGLQSNIRNMLHSEA